MTDILRNNCHLTFRYVILLYMDINRRRKNAERRTKADFLRHNISKGIQDYRDGRDMYQ